MLLVAPARGGPPRCLYFVQTHAHAERTDICSMNLLNASVTQAHIHDRRITFGSTNLHGGRQQHHSSFQRTDRTDRHTDRTAGGKKKQTTNSDSDSLSPCTEQMSFPAASLSRSLSPSAPLSPSPSRWSPPVGLHDFIWLNGDSRVWSCCW